MEDMRSLGWRWRSCDEVCEINGGEVVKRGEARCGEVLRICVSALKCVCRCEFILSNHQGCSHLSSDQRSLTWRPVTSTP